MGTSDLNTTYNYNFHVRRNIPVVTTKLKANKTPAHTLVVVEVVTATKTVLGNWPAAASAPLKTPSFFDRYFIDLISWIEFIR